jgi:hypothetical protein
VSELPELPDRLCGADLRLVVPPRVSTRYAILMALQDLRRDSRAVRPSHLVLVAALGVCWPRVSARIPFEGDVLAFGTKVVDLLLDPGVKLAPGDSPPNMLELVRAGMAAVALIEGSLPDVEQVNGARVFSQAPSGASSASDSRSSVGGGATPGGSEV